MSRFGRIIGVDVGGKRVGLARTDLLRSSVNPIGTFTPKNSLLEIERQIANEGPVKALVIGWPLTPLGEPTHATPLVSDYIKKLKIKYPEMDIFKFDERYSSREAMRLMAQSGVPKKKRHKKGRLDQAAAALILTQFLEAYPEI